MSRWPWNRSMSTTDAASSMAKSHFQLSTVSTSVANTHPSLPSPVTQHVSLSSQSRRRRQLLSMDTLHVHWGKIKRRIGPTSYPDADLSASSDSLAESIRSSFIHHHHHHSRPHHDPAVVDIVVVDRSWSEDFKSSDPDASPDTTASQLAFGSHEPSDSLGFQGSWSPLDILRYRIWPVINEFFDSSFHDEAAEERYQQDYWANRKPLAFAASLWFALNFVLGCIFMTQPKQPLLLADKIFYFGVASVFTLPIVGLVLYDLPRHKALWYQLFIAVSCWIWPIYQVAFICQGREFTGILYYATALQVIALFGLSQARLPALLGAVAFIIISCCLVVPDQVTWIRSIINQIAFHSFLLYIHYTVENAGRRLFKLREERGVQIKAMKRAQANERQAADSKKRLTSYVRVPLNTALLAVQNMQAERSPGGGFNPRASSDSEIEWTALEGSLSMMSKVLNDVLDFDRMDSGKFESANRPYAFHQVLRSLFVPLRLATDARNLALVVDLDPAIDKIARYAAYSATGETSEAIERHLEAYPDVDGVVMGDEARLRQVITNLASNGCKFTPPGGKLTIRTRLVEPRCEDYIRPATPAANSESGHALSCSHLNIHNQTLQPPYEVSRIIVRIEVSDTGCGIKQEDMYPGSGGGLFSAFNQTELGRTQGGKGTGLGLALVRQIVKLSGGRLGLHSKVGEGSTFWVELPLGVGRQTLDCPGDMDSSRTLAGDVQPEMSETRSKSFIMTAVDAAALKATQAPPPSTRSNSALHSLMEQGGRVELLLARPESTSSLDKMGENASTMQKTLPKSIDNTPDSSADSTPAVTPPVKTASRPTYLPLPSPPIFPVDLEPSPELCTPNRHTPASTSSHMSALDRNAAFGKMPATPLSPSCSLNVLVVDDDAVTRLLMTRLLTRLGCTVRTAEDGEAALGLILSTSPEWFANKPTPSSERSMGPILEQESTHFDGPTNYDLVFLDNQMPKLSGLNTIAKLRELGRRDFVVGLTGNALLSDQKEYLEAGVDHVLTKPVLEQSIREMITIAEERRKSYTP